MKRTGPIALLLALMLVLSACGAGPTADSAAISTEPTETAQLSQTTAPASQNTEGEGDIMDKIVLSFSGHTYTATLTDNPSAQAFAELLKDGPLTVSAHDYGNFEKVASLGTELPRTDEQITTTPGDIILYQGNQITVYYAQNTWSFTRLGRVDDPTDLVENAGVEPTDITVYDVSRLFPDHMVELCTQGNLKGVRFANLKGHSYGITLCGKNHFGSFINGNAMRSPLQRPLYRQCVCIPGPGGHRQRGSGFPDE